MILETLFHELWQVMLDLSPSLLLGLFIAGLMHVYLPKDFVHRGLSRPGLKSVTRASLIGVPLPLCSLRGHTDCARTAQRGGLQGGHHRFLLGRRISAALEARPARPADAGDLTLKVDGMSCQHCVASVKKSLEGLDAVEEAAPSLASGLVRVRGSHLDVSALVQAVEKAGFRVTESLEA